MKSSLSMGLLSKLIALCRKIWQLISAMDSSRKLSTVSFPLWMN